MPRAMIQTTTNRMNTMSRDSAAEIRACFVACYIAAVLDLGRGKDQGEDGKRGSKSKQHCHAHDLAWSAYYLGKGKHGDSAAIAPGNPCSPL